jgi:hypothetical protein
VSAAVAQASRRLYGLIAEYDTPEDVVRAAEAARKAGYTKIDAYTPHPVEGSTTPWRCSPRGSASWCWRSGCSASPPASAAVVRGRRVLPAQHRRAPAQLVAQLHRHHLRGHRLALRLHRRPGHARPQRLPRPYHPVFNAPGFERASRDGYYLCVESVDPRFDPDDTRTFLEGTAPVRVQEVAR